MISRTATRGAHNSHPIAEKLWRSVDRSGGPDACWPWIGKSRINTKKGVSYYGLIGVRVGGGWRQVTAHRVALIIKEGRPEEEAYTEPLQGLHSCDNPPCCNPVHLHWGTQKQNLIEMANRGRRGKTGATGSRNGSAKLTEADVPIIRSRLAAKERPATIAEDYGVSPALIYNIRNSVSWSHVPKES